MQRISLLMFKIYKSDVPKPIYICLEQIIHIIHIIQEEVTISIHLLVEQKPYYETFSFNGVHI